MSEESGTFAPKIPKKVLFSFAEREAQVKALVEAARDLKNTTMFVQIRLGNMRSGIVGGRFPLLERVDHDLEQIKEALKPFEEKR